LSNVPHTSSSIISWVEEARQEVYRKEPSRICVPSIDDLVFSTSFSTVTKEEEIQEYKRVGFSLVTEGATNEANWIVGFSSVTNDASIQEDWRERSTSVMEGVASQEDWSVAMVEETKSLPKWETKVHPEYGVWDTSLTKREFCLL